MSEAPAANSRLTTGDLTDKLANVIEYFRLESKATNDQISDDLAQRARDFDKLREAFDELMKTNNRTIGTLENYIAFTDGVLRTSGRNPDRIDEQIMTTGCQVSDEIQTALRINALEMRLWTLATGACLAFGALAISLIARK